eukprot:TRINITY_DN572_c0_g1_i1.p1 TRINITY_DN572_c0_g1~~TRINITY_DN572_c0_g1_i1.p1  ORF type:complete len:464 (+),score=42.12 TRINITY_DN572_c0_g1_i1:59-1393(+)
MPEEKKPSRPFEGDWVTLAPHVKPHGCLQAGQCGKVLQDTSFQNPASSLCYQVQAPQGRPSWYSLRDLCVVQWPPPPPARALASSSDADGAVCEAECVAEAPVEETEHTMTTSEAQVQIEITIPAVRAAKQLNIDLSDDRVLVSPTDGCEDVFEAVCVPIRVPVDSDSATAKWEKKRKTLRILLPRRPGSVAALRAQRDAAVEQKEDGVPPPTEQKQHTAAGSTELCTPPKPVARKQDGVPPPTEQKKHTDPAGSTEQDATLASSDDTGRFEASERWTGAREGWYFGCESLGLGYYRDWRLVEVCGGLELGQRVYAARDITVGSEVAVREGDVGFVHGPGRSNRRVRVRWVDRRDQAAWHSLAQAQALECALDAVCPRLLAPGARVRTTGLSVTRAALEGQEGVVSCRSGDRWGVRFDDPSLGEKALRRANLEVLRGAEDAQQL